MNLTTSFRMAQSTGSGILQMQMQMRCNAMPALPACQRLFQYLEMYIHVGRKGLWYPFTAHSTRAPAYIISWPPPRPPPVLLEVVTLLEIPTVWGGVVGGWGKREISEGNRYYTRTNPLKENERKIRVRAAFFFLFCSLWRSPKFTHAGTYKRPCECLT